MEVIDHDGETRRDRRSRRPTRTVGGLLLAGAGLRVAHWARGETLWLDEALLANNIVKRSAEELVFQPLGAMQNAPAGFLALVRSLVVVAGPGERSLRLLPLLAGLALLAVIWVGSRELFTRRRGAAVAVGVISLSPSLVYYSTELKPYMGDALATAAILLLVHRHGRAPESSAVLVLGLVVAPWFSFPSLFVIGAALLAIGVDVHRRWSVLAGNVRRRLLVDAALVTSSAAAAFLHAQSVVANPDGNASYWRRAFPDHRGWARWALDTAVELPHVTFRSTGVANGAANLGVPTLALALISAAIVVFGLRALRNRADLLAHTATLSVVLAVAANAAGRYPLRGRLALFLVPVVALGVAAAVERLHGRPRRRASALLIAAPALLLSAAWVEGVYPERGDLGVALARIDDQANPRDVVVASIWTRPQLHFETERRPLRTPWLDELVVDKAFDAAAFDIEARPEVEGHRVWLVFSKYDEEIPRFLDGLERRSWTVEESWADRDIHVVLVSP